MSGIDYSRWDSLNVESEDDSGPSHLSEDPIQGSRVRIENLERSKEYNGREGRVIDVLGDGIFAVELEGSTRTVLKVRRKHMVVLAGNEVCRDQSSVHSASLSNRPNGGGIPQVNLLNTTTGSNAQGVSAAVAPPAFPRPAPPATPPPVGLDSLLLRTFHSPALRAEYGRAFEAGAARRVAEAMAARGILLPAAASGPNAERLAREAVVRLAWKVEEEILLARRGVEHAALHRRFEGGGGGGGGGGGLEELDRATRAARRLLWAIDCLQYGEVFRHLLPLRIDGLQGAAKCCPVLKDRLPVLYCYQ